MLMRTAHRWVRPKRLLPPGFVVPCQPTLAAKVPAGDGWIPRAEARWLPHPRLQGRRHRSPVVSEWPGLGGRVRGITEAMQALPFKRVMFNGEAVAHCP
jgi:hypothetical protein